MRLGHDNRGDPDHATARLTHSHRELERQVSGRDRVVSDLEPADHLVSTLWSLTGRTLTSEALPRLRR